MYSNRLTERDVVNIAKVKRWRVDMRDVWEEKKACRKRWVHGRRQISDEGHSFKPRDAPET